LSNLQIVPLTPNIAARVKELQGKPLPPEITELKERIAGATQVAILCAHVTKQVDQGDIDRIVAMKRELDGLYGKHLRGEL